MDKASTEYPEKTSSRTSPLEPTLPPTSSPSPQPLSPAPLAPTHHPTISLPTALRALKTPSGSHSLLASSSRA